MGQQRLSPGVLDDMVEVGEIGAEGVRGEHGDRDDPRQDAGQQALYEVQGWQVDEDDPIARDQAALREQVVSHPKRPLHQLGVAAIDSHSTRRIQEAHPSRVATRSDLVCEPPVDRAVCSTARLDHTQ